MSRQQHPPPEAAILAAILGIAFILAVVGGWRLGGWLGGSP